MEKKRKIVRIYLIPILASVTAVVFWWAFRDEERYYWWLALIALITLAHYLVYWKWERGRVLKD
ncbi:MAG: hypothetical protein CO141_03160 [Candidatus Moranbacteria bacterium CG_4_9_14_3_um_filter_42_9]|nr:MAG: hypothetical protein CO141_03160 [Candidatus Moranbacteria bacterium CG_4_9_14_3_um_filter_42_9]